jgi:hypothetical protein
MFSNSRRRGVSNYCRNGTRRVRSRVLPRRWGCCLLWDRLSCTCKSDARLSWSFRADGFARRGFNRCCCCPRRLLSSLQWLGSASKRYASLLLRYSCCWLGDCRYICRGIDGFNRQLLAQAGRSRHDQVGDKVCFSYGGQSVRTRRTCPRRGRDTRRAGKFSSRRTTEIAADRLPSSRTSVSRSLSFVFLIRLALKRHSQKRIMVSARPTDRCSFEGLLRAHIDCGGCHIGRFAVGGSLKLFGTSGRRERWRRVPKKEPDGSSRGLIPMSWFWENERDLQCCGLSRSELCQLSLMVSLRTVSL